MLACSSRTAAVNGRERPHATRNRLRNVSAEMGCWCITLCTASFYLDPHELTGFAATRESVVPLCLAGKKRSTPPQQ
jgi:hypothetical protein